MKIDYPFVSVVIPVRNGEKIIGRCLKSLEKLNYPKDKYEVIVADGGSTDKTGEIVGKYRTILIDNPGLTVCAGRNEGFKMARGQLVAFSDDDCVMEKNWIRNAVKYFNQSDIGAVGGPNYVPSDETDFARAVGFIFNRWIFSAGSCQGRILKEVKEVKALPGSNAIYCKEALAKVLPLDTKFIEAEDYIMNQKVRQAGYRLLYTPDTIVWHYRRSIPKKFFRQMYRYAVGRLLIAKADSKNINLMHILVGLGLPISIIISFLLLILNPSWFLALAATGLFFLFSYFLLALVQLKSFKAALFVPYAIVLLFLGWSTGFLRELLFPVKRGVLLKHENSNG